jgi:hypothetical protein
LGPLINSINLLRVEWLAALAKVITFGKFRIDVSERNADSATPSFVIKVVGQMHYLSNRVNILLSPIRSNLKPKPFIRSLRVCHAKPLSCTGARRCWQTSYAAGSQAHFNRR